MTQLHKTEDTRKVWLRHNGEKMHFLISKEFEMQTVREIVENEYPNARPVLMLVENAAKEPEAA